MYRTKPQFERALIGAVIALSPLFAAAQTIQQYSDAQKQVIASEVSKSYGSPTPAPAATAPAAPAADAAAPKIVPVAYIPPKAPTVQVAGVTHLQGRHIAEVIVDNTVHLVPQGVRVPGTKWIVREADISRVVLLQPRDPKVKRSKDVTRVINLPSIEVR